VQNKAKQNSLNYVSHEFRTPLNCIITILHHCEETSPPAQLPMMRTAIANCYYLLNLSNDLLDLA
jgi:signal transduction histidine kinase